MYEHFYGLREHPFSLTSNLKYFLLTSKHQEALSNLEYGISTNPGMTLLLGHAGTGKTTLLRKVRVSWMQSESGDSIRWVSLNNPLLTPSEFLDTLGHALALGSDCASSKSKFLRALEQTLIEQREGGSFTVLVIDEAQSLSDALLEELRLLTNIERESEMLLRLVLAGQPALGDRLNEPALGQLKQRIALRCQLPTLDLHETAGYIAHRISLAGGNPGRVFSREAVAEIHERSGGIPRTINVLCENALLTGFAADEQPVGRAIVLDVCRDFDLPAAIEMPIRSRRADAAHGAAVVSSMSDRGAAAVEGAPPTAGTGRRFSFAQFASRRR